MSDTQDTTAESKGTADASAVRRRHMRFGWVSLLVYLTMGAGLEVLHGFKSDWYLSASNDYRRLLLTLAHAHGTLLALVHLAFAAGLPSLSTLSARSRALASACLCASSILLPLGFLIGGLFLHGSDPGLGVLLVPVGAILLIVGVALIAKAAWRSA